MPLPLLEFKNTTRNYRVNGFEVLGDDSPRIFSAEYLVQSLDYDDLINAAYRQIFNEQHFTKSARLTALESQLRNGQITVRAFIQGLLTSTHFRTRNYETNNNYRFVQMCFQRVLGRDIETERETLAWSIILATKGIEGFANDLLSSDEYLDAFGEFTVPYQRRRTLPQRSMGDVSFSHMARYDANHLAQLKALGHDFDGENFSAPNGGLPPASVRKVGAALTYAGAAFFGVIAISVFLSWIGIIQI